MVPKSVSLVRLSIVFCLWTALILPAPFAVQAAPPQNDDFSQASVISTLPYTDLPNLAEATRADDDPWVSCVDYDIPTLTQTVWYAYTPAQDSILKAIVADHYPLQVSAFSGERGNLNFEGCGRDVIVFSATAGVTYYFMIEAASAPVEGITFSLEAVVPPANDDFDQATVISSLPYDVTADTDGATRASDDPPDEICSNSSLTKTLWWSYTAQQDGQLEAHISGDYTIAIGVYTGSRGSLTRVAAMGCDDLIYPRFNVQAGETYYFMVNAQDAHTEFVYFSLIQIPPPSNDSFASAGSISTVPFNFTFDLSSATFEAGEPEPSCAMDQGPIKRTIWLVYTPEQDGYVTAGLTYAYFSDFLAAYQGPSLDHLTELACRVDSQPMLVPAHAGAPIYFQVGGRYASGWEGEFSLYIPPEPGISFYPSPSDPSIFDEVHFIGNYNDQGGGQYASVLWDLGDGTTSTEWEPVHRYAADGDYTVTLTGVTEDGRTGTFTHVVKVATHDVTVRSIKVPHTVRAGMTRTITVDLRSLFYTETVDIWLMKAYSDGYEWASEILTLDVPPGKKPLKLKFKYTFTEADAALGTVAFDAVVQLRNGRDVSPENNTLRSRWVIVKP